MEENDSLLSLFWSGVVEFLDFVIYSTNPVHRRDAL